jgi:isopenicillin N synthase-like dioxygenase
MDAVSREYTHLLTSQLESQRQYYEEMRLQDAAQHQQQISKASAEAETCRKECEGLSRRCALVKVTGCQTALSNRLLCQIACPGLDYEDLQHLVYLHHLLSVATCTAFCEC